MHDHGALSPANVLAHVAPDFWDSLSDSERAVVPYMHEIWIRPDQRIPSHDWRSCGLLAGRGYGKSYAIAVYVNGQVERRAVRHVGLMAPTEPRVDEVQIEFLIATAPPWFRPKRHRDGLVWPNGVRANVFTPEAPGRSRSENISLSWLCEIVDWQATTRREAYDNITTATRIKPAKVIWDTTSMGRNEIIELLLENHARDPHAHPILRGSMFDNPVLTKKYISDECRKYKGQRAREELFGEVFTGKAGALWKQTTIDLHRRLEHPIDVEQTLVSIDPALSEDKSADETGMVVGSLGRDGHCYLREDLSERMSPDRWGNRALDACARYNAAGCIIERNHLGDNAAHTIVAAAKTRGLTVRIIPRDKKHEAEPFPSRTPGVIYIREVVSATSKCTRAQGPAAETEEGRVHHVGTLHDLEYEMTTYVPGTSRSPNRYDAANQLIIELAGLDRPKEDTSGEANIAARLHEELRGQLRRVNASRRVGL